MSAPADLNGNTSSVVFLNKNIAVGSGTATIAGVDLKDFINNVKVVLAYTQGVAAGSGGIAINFLDSADNTTFAAITSPSITTQTLASGTVEASIDTRNVRRYVQVQHVVTGTTNTVVASVIGVGVKQVI